jgi:hypothetical protein
MAYTFVSHASEDKRERVKPLVETLLWLGVRVWVDRPGSGQNDFGFDQDYIEKYQIRSLRSGLGWREQIDAALGASGAVLVCISRALCAQRQVLVQELLLGRHHQKLVACIVDDISYSEIPRDLGLADADGLQADRIDTAALRRAIDCVKQTEAQSAYDVLPPELMRQWELVRKLVSDINQIYAKSGRLEPSDREIDEAAGTIGHIPIGPVVQFHEIPMEMISLFSERLADPEHARRFFRTAMQVRARCNPEGFTDRQILVAPGEVLNPATVTAEEFWSTLFSAAGQKSRRTLAALLLAPGAPHEDTLRPTEASALRKFKKRLAQPAEALKSEISGQPGART